MSTLTYLGIYVDAIKEEIEKAHDLLCDVKEFLNKHSPLMDRAYQQLARFDLDETAGSYLQEYGKFSDITNSIIAAYYEAIKDALGGIEIFQEDIELFIIGYVNCYDSHLYIIVDNEMQSEYYGSGDFEGIFFDFFRKRYMDDIVKMIEEHFKGTSKTYPKEWIEEDFYTTGGGIDFVSEYIESVQSGRLTGNLVNYIEENANQN